MTLNWHDTRAVAALLFERYDTLDPRTVRLADLRKWVVDLEDFDGRPEQAEEPMLQAIQDAWHQQWKEEYGEG